MKVSFLLASLFLVTIGQAQTFEFTFEAKWSEVNKHCIPCDYNEITGDVTSTITKEIGLRGDYTFTTRLIHVNYSTIDLPTYYNKDVLPANANETF